VLLVALPALPGTVGSGWLTYIPNAEVYRLPGVGNWVGLFVVFGPLVGFNLIFFGAPQSVRRRHLGWLLAVTGVEVLVAALATLWLAGADVAPGRVLDPDSRGIGILGVCQGVPAIMFVAPRS
jgi:hypothetical protein